MGWLELPGMKVPSFSYEVYDFEAISFKSRDLFFSCSIVVRCEV